MFSVSFSVCVAGNIVNSTLFTGQPVHPDPTRPVVLDTKQSKATSSTASASGEVAENVPFPREPLTANLYISPRPSSFMMEDTDLGNVDESRCESTQVPTFVAFYC